MNAIYGCSTRGEFPDFPTAGRLALRLEAAGVDAASVTDVVLTHMHMDHIGGLLSDGLGSRLRPDLRVHVAAAEAEFWESPDFSHTNMPEGVREWLAELSSEDPSGAHAVEVATRGSNLRRR